MANALAGKKGRKASKSKLPVISQQPEGRSATVGDRVNISVGVGGEDGVTFQWLKDGAGLPGETGSVVRLDPVALADAGHYAVLVSNATEPP